MENLKVKDGNVKKSLEQRIGAGVVALALAFAGLGFQAKKDDNGKVGLEVKSAVAEVIGGGTEGGFGNGQAEGLAAIDDEETKSNPSNTNSNSTNKKSNSSGKSNEVIEYVPTYLYGMLSICPFTDSECREFFDRGEIPEALKKSVELSNSGDAFFYYLDSKREMDYEYFDYINEEKGRHIVYRSMTLMTNLASLIEKIDINNGTVILYMADSNNEETYLTPFGYNVALYEHLSQIKGAIPDYVDAEMQKYIAEQETLGIPRTLTKEEALATNSMIPASTLPIELFSNNAPQ